MTTGATDSAPQDIVALARERVRIGPTPDWVTAQSYPADFKPKSSTPITHLLSDRQVHAGLHQTYIHVANRLETATAVQHLSQWRLQFTPQSQSITIHSIKIRRRDLETECAALNRFDFLRREAGLEGFIIDGWVTLLSLLEDVRPGDIIDWSYTIETRTSLLPDSYYTLFPLLEGAQLGKLHSSIRFAENRPLKWKSSSADLAPVETRENSEVRWVWLREDFTTPEPEKQTPSWFISQPWIQISDCTDWQTVAIAFADAWQKKTVTDTDALAELYRRLTADETDPVRQVDRAIQMVQDEFRYLSINLELDGQVPADAATVVRRRYGDCKDLAFLLVELLRRLGISARPILVNTALRKSIGDMLPAPGLFNHAIVEFQLQGQTRWVDATLKWQGGDALHRPTPDYGAGLPIDRAATALAMPPPQEAASRLEVKEHILLDTTGDLSHLAVTVIATGAYAESFRAEFADESLEAIEKKRLQACANKFHTATRVGNLQHRDDRPLNQFVLSEVFEVNGFLKRIQNSNLCVFHITNGALNVLPLPPALPRRTPYALPHPCSLVHTIQIESLGLGVTALPAFRMKNDFFETDCTSRGVRKFTSMTFTMTALVDAVLPDQLEHYKNELVAIDSRGSALVRLPVGVSRIRKRHDFGALPSPADLAPRKTPNQPKAAQAAVLGSQTPVLAVASVPPSEDTRAKLLAAAQKVTLRDSDEVEAERRARRSQRRRLKSTSSPGKSKNEFKWIIALVIGFVLLIAFLFIIGSAFH